MKSRDDWISLTQKHDFTYLLQTSNSNYFMLTQVFDVMISMIMKATRMHQDKNEF